jgi:hypothetical protein
VVFLLNALLGNINEILKSRIFVVRGSDFIIQLSKILDARADGLGAKTDGLLILFSKQRT